MLADERRDLADRVVKCLPRVGVAGADLPQPCGSAREDLPEERAVERLFAAKMVVEHCVVDASAAGDAVDPGARVAALLELERGDIEDAVRGHGGGSRHIN